MRRGSGWGSGDTPTYIPESDPHDALISLRYVSRGEDFSEKFQSGLLCGPISEPSLSQRTVFIKGSDVYKYDV